MANQHIQTKLVQIGNRSEHTTGAVNPPIYLSTAYRHEGIGLSTGYDYTRTKNPTRALLEESFAKLEEGDQAFACSSGMAAIQLVLSLFQKDDELLSFNDLYGGTYRLFNQYEKSYGIKTSYVKVNDYTGLENAITEKTKAIYIETPTNPLMIETDIEKVAHIAKNITCFSLWITPF